jgi:cobalt/nickel transport system permease protein
MHMADALISPGVGATMWVASAGLIGYCSKKVRTVLDDRRVPLMGVLGAFIFAAQMINFAIPGTGSSGHLGGGIMLAILLGPHAAFLVIASVLVVQALFFADGGLLALGCNIFNLGFFPCLLVYPLVAKCFMTGRPTPVQLWLGAVFAAVLGLQMGAFAVVLETRLSGVSDLPLGPFLALMQPIHLAIGIVEGVATAAVVTFVWKARPEILETATPATYPIGRILVGLLLAAALTAGILSWFASSRPDGLEWAMLKASGTQEPALPEHGIHESLDGIQQKTALLPDYDFASQESAAGEGSAETWPAIDTGTTAAGLVGGVLCLLVALSAGYALKRRRIAA